MQIFHIRKINSICAPKQVNGNFHIEQHDDFYNFYNFGLGSTKFNLIVGV